MLRRSLDALARALLVSIMLAAAVPTVTLAGAMDCSLLVTPAAGPPGTEFVFKGSTYTPDTLTLERKGWAPRVIQLDLKGADPFEIRLVAAEGDEGKWVATAEEHGGTECAGTATIRVTLPPTATAEDQAPTLARNAGMAGFAALAVIFLVATGILMRPFRRRVSPGG